MALLSWLGADFEKPLPWAMVRCSACERELAAAVAGSPTDFGFSDSLTHEGSLVLGAVLAVVDLVDICPGRMCRCGPWAAIGMKHWKLANPRPLADPVPASGRLGLWDIDLPEVGRG